MSLRANTHKGKKLFGGTILRKEMVGNKSPPHFIDHPYQRLFLCYKRLIEACTLDAKFMKGSLLLGTKTAQSKPQAGRGRPTCLPQIRPGAQSCFPRVVCSSPNGTTWSYATEIGRATPSSRIRAALAGNRRKDQAQRPLLPFLGWPALHSPPALFRFPLPP